MAIRKNKVVSYYGTESAQRGDIKYWDSSVEEWVVLHIGNEGDILYTDGPGLPPYWASKPSSSSSSSSSAIASSSSGIASSSSAIASSSSGVASSSSAVASSSSSGVASSSSAITSSSSSVVQPVGPSGIRTAVLQPTLGISKKTGSGTSDAHLTLGGSTGSVTTHDRSGKEYEKVAPPFNASWNYEDNAHAGSSTPVVYFGMRDPKSYKQTCVSYDQDRLTSSLGYCITGVNVDSRNWAGSNSGSVSISDSLGDYTGNILSITSDATYGGEFKLSIVGNNLTLKDQSDVDIIAPITLAIVPVPDSNPIQWVYPKIKVSLPSVKFEIEADFPMGDISTHIYRIIIGSKFNGAEAGKYWADSLNLCALNPDLYPNGGVGGLFFKNLERCVDYDSPGNGIVYDPNEPGYESQTYSRVIDATPSSSSAAKIGTWGWYNEIEKEGLYSSSSSGVLVPVIPPISPVNAHFLPINFNPPSATENIDDYIGSGKRASYAYPADPNDLDEKLDTMLEIYGGSDLTLTQYKFNLMVIIYDLLLDNTGYWQLDGWCDDTIRINGEKICCLSGLSPFMRVTVSGLNWFITDSSSSSSRSLSIDWCDETWTPEEDGETKEICPDQYRVLKGFSNGFSYLDWDEWWNKGPNPTSLRLARGITNFYFTMPPTEYQTPAFSQIAAGIYLYPNKNDGFGSYIDAHYPFGGSNFSMGLLSTNKPNPVASTESYRITDDFFGSHTTSHGVTFSWAKSPNWDAVVEQVVRENQ